VATKKGIPSHRLVSGTIITSIILGLVIGPVVFADIGISARAGSSTDKVLVLGSVFGLRDSKPKYETVILPKNIQTLSLLQAPKNVDPQASLALAMPVVDDSALTNQNTGLDGSQIGGSEFKPANDQISVYVVKSGDTLDQIADMYDVTVNTIRWANDIGTKESIQPGQVLVILPVAGIRYTVKKGDTISKIAKAYNADLDETARFNNLDTDSALIAGSVIIIPDVDGGLTGPGHEGGNSNTNSGSNSSKTTSKNVATNTGKSTTGYFTRPVIGGVRTQGIHGHNGVDIAAALGTPILAAADGEVIISKSGGWNGGYGTYIVVKHSNGTQTLYGHLQETLVSVGERVSKGQQIGKMGSTGQSTGVHIHFEVRGGKNPF